MGFLMGISLIYASIKLKLFGKGVPSFKPCHFIGQSCKSGSNGSLFIPERVLNNEFVHKGNKCRIKIQ